MRRLLANGLALSLAAAAGLAAAQSPAPRAQPEERPAPRGEPAINLRLDDAELRRLRTQSIPQDVPSQAPGRDAGSLPELGGDAATVPGRRVRPFDGGSGGGPYPKDTNPMN